jgi:hypothetical protein
VPHDEVVARLLDALHSGDDTALTRLLARDARMVVDTGDASGGVLSGRIHCARRLLALPASFPAAAFVVVDVNATLGLALRIPTGLDVAVLSLTSDTDGLINRVWVSAAPHKLAFWNGQREMDR